MSLFYNLSKIDDVCAKDKKTEEPADFTGIDTDDPEYIKYQYEIDHYGTGYHEKIKKWQDFVEQENATEREELEGMALIVEVTEALLVLNIQSDYIITKDIEAAYYKAVAKYHLPHNPAWLEMRKITLVAYNILMAQNLYKINKIACLSHDLYDYGEIINIALNKVVDLPNLSIEIDRAWVRINGNTEAYREVLTQAGFCQGEGTVWFFQPWNRMESIGK